MGKNTSENKIVEISKYKVSLKEGIRIGLILFIVSYVVAFLLAIIINFTVMGSVQSAVLGAINSNNQIGFGGIIKLTSVILSLSAFNSINSLEIGISFFSLIPFAVIFIIGGKEKRDINSLNMFIYLIASIMFSVLLTLLQGLTRGRLLDVSVNIFSIKNFFITIFIIFLIQIILALNNSKKSKSYILATRLLLRLALGLGGILAIIDIIILIIKLPLGLLSRLGAGLLLFPNITIYKFFMIMGNSLKISDSLNKLIVKAGVLGISSEGYSLLISIILIIAWIAIVMVSSLALKKERYFQELPLFALLFSIISAFLAFLTSINLGKIILVGEMNIGINIIPAFLVPFLSIMALGVVVWLVRKMLTIIKEI